MSRTIAATVFIVAILTAPPVWACTCVGYTSGEERFEKADAVFEGEVIAMETVARPAGRGWYPSIEARLRVRRIWKGIAGREAKVRTTSSGCAAPFHAAKRYFVFAHRWTDPKSGEVALLASLCTVDDADSVIIGRLLARFPSSPRTLGLPSAVPRITTTASGVSGLVRTRSRPAM